MKLICMGKGGGTTNCKAMVAPGVMLELPRGGSVEITPGVLDDAARYAFSAGHCHALALAIHERTGWPMLAMSGRYSAYKDLQHVVVVMPDGKWLDVQGPRDPEEELHRHKQAINADEVSNMGRIRHWKNPQLEIAREFVDAVFAEHGISQMLKQTLASTEASSPAQAS